MPKRVDGNHRQILDDLRRVGCSVLSLAPLGHGVPDALIGRHGVNVLVEIKTARGQLNALQRAWQAGWRGHPVTVVRSTDEALALLNNLRV